jgi:L-ascorbate metabolism protein UlaG (beta-lactamase superfamily)
MKIKYFGHSSFALVKKNLRLLFDPWYHTQDFPPNLLPKHHLKKPTEDYDYIFITHAHADHCDPKLIHTLAHKNLRIITGQDSSNLLHHPNIVINPGEQYTDENISVQAIEMAHKVPTLGFFIKIPESIYYLGDTKVSPQVWEDISSPFLLFIPIGGKYTMNMDEAAELTSILRPEHVIPMHYNTWPDINLDIHQFPKLVTEKTVGVQTHILKIGQEIKI